MVAIQEPIQTRSGQLVCNGSYYYDNYGEVLEGSGEVK